jgi:CRISPR system Cascade subunit CasD
MCSWGDIAVGETRPSFPHPTKSAIMGMVAAALGIRRSEEDKHCQLVGAYTFSVLVENMGKPLVDYHTAQVPSGKERHATRKDELTLIPKHELKTILSSRDYRMDAFYTVVLRERGQCPWNIEQVRNALIQPVFTLYLGRKSCPPALLLEPQIVDSPTVREALLKVRFIDASVLFGLTNASTKELYWEDGVDAGIEMEQTFERRDVPLSRQRWQFDVRREHHAAFE